MPTAGLTSIVARRAYSSVSLYLRWHSALMCATPAATEDNLSLISLFLYYHYTTPKDRLPRRFQLLAMTIYERLIPIALLRKSGNDVYLYCFQLLAMTQA